LTADVDILIPAALGEVLTEELAKELRAGIVVEAANAPTTPTADAVLTARGIPVFPDILANAGGVTVSYFEWAQNIQCFRWSEQEVNRRLEQVMHDSYRPVRTVVEQRQLSWRMAAYVVALGRVAKATVLRGV
jgi:glutamate dehydrogenase (NAD(P)+)